MAVTKKIEHAKKTVYVTAEGDVTFRDIRNHLFKERHGNGRPYAECIDARAASPAFSSNEIRAIVSLLRVFARKQVLGPTAVVVNSERGFGVMQMFEKLVDDICEIRAFREPEGAQQWLEATHGRRG